MLETAQSSANFLYRQVIELISDNIDIKCEDLLGQGMTVRLKLHGEDEERFFHGAVNRFSQVGCTMQIHSPTFGNMSPFFLKRT